MVLRLGASSSRMKGWVYVITNKAHTDLVKIGFSTKDPELRAKEFGTASAYTFVVEYDALVEEPQPVEQRAHKLLASKREDRDREWFRCSIEEAIIAIKMATRGVVLHEKYREAERVKGVADRTAKSGFISNLKKLAKWVFWLAVVGCGIYFYNQGGRENSAPLPPQPNLSPAEHSDLEPNPPRQGNTSVVPTPTPTLGPVRSGYGYAKGNTSAMQTPLPTPARTPTPTPSAPPITPQPVQATKKTFAAQQRAMAKFPELGVEGSRLNRAFAVTVRRYQVAKPEIFNDPDWPTKLATEAAASLK